MLCQDMKVDASISGFTSSSQAGGAFNKWHQFSGAPRWPRGAHIAVSKTRTAASSAKHSIVFRTDRPSDTPADRHLTPGHQSITGLDRQTENHATPHSAITLGIATEGHQARAAPAVNRVSDAMVLDRRWTHRAEQSRDVPEL